MNIITDTLDSGVTFDFDKFCEESPCRTLAIDVSRAYSLTFGIKVITKQRSFVLTSTIEVTVGTSELTPAIEPLEMLKP